MYFQLILEMIEFVILVSSGMALGRAQAVNLMLGYEMAQQIDPHRMRSIPMRYNEIHLIWFLQGADDLSTSLPSTSIGWLARAKASLDCVFCFFVLCLDISGNIGGERALLHFHESFRAILQIQIAKGDLVQLL